MGSLNASGIPVPAKTPDSYRKFDNRIISTDNRDDSRTLIANDALDVSRAIGSGSIVRDNGNVEYYEELVFGVTRMGRTCQERIASDTGCVRTVVVDLAGNSGIVVIENSLKPTIPQKWAGHTGNRVLNADSATDTTTRVSNEGAFD